MLILGGYLGFSYVERTPSGNLMTLAKVGVESSNLFARSKFPNENNDLSRPTLGSVQRSQVV